ncbi:hypothetical protein BFP97_07000 [Roseivirga sp. 4D4]|uniref:tetratricopeptide repeat-containing sensor histidine kinase n=1 Tax=Roseivirga sp. 4D4 TaxID=1889784 RepID=UPI0008530679|nr:histidine kinase [Roseivirga sp. 4D4]OEK01274.1 hypothetical protein BFP97_07000 [Roseivirga sp. 4D4]
MFNRLSSIFILLTITLFSCQKDEVKPETIGQEDLDAEFKKLVTRIEKNGRRADSIRILTNSLVSIAHKLNNDNQLGTAFRIRASAFEMASQFDSAIYLYQKSATHFVRSKDSVSLADAYKGLGTSYYFQNLFDSALVYYQKSADLLYSYTDKTALAKAYSNLGMVLTASDLSDQALSYYQKALVITKDSPNPMDKLPTLLNISALFLKEEVYDSALIYANQVNSISRRSNIPFGVGKSASVLASIHLAQQNLDQAEKEILESIQIFFETQMQRDLMAVKWQYAQILFAKNEHRKAIELTDEVLTLPGGNTLAKNVYQLQSQSYENLGQKEEALTTYKKYHTTFEQIADKRNKDIIAEKEIEFNSELKNREILRLKNEADINELKIEQRNIMVFIAVIITVLVLIITYLLLRSLKARSNKQVMELENRLLRTQLNPHFLFNAMGAIQQYIYNKEDPTIISDYLGKFSRLTRMILNYSKEELITLKEELEFLDHYIQLQQIRFEVPFDFKVETDSTIDPDELLIPPMLTQPFIENAIEHGFLHKDTKGHITLTINEKNDQVMITVEDDGVGRKQAALLNKKTKHQSMATQITIDRLKLIQRKLRRKTDFLITDLFDSQNQALGTRVSVNLPLIKE